MGRLAEHFGHRVALATDLKRRADALHVMAEQLKNTKEERLFEKKLIEINKLSQELVLDVNKLFH
jgi:hypothetical protein